jgi:predicted alpha/beta hydrolase family esterase
MTPIVIVPSLGGSGETHWQTHLQRSLPNATRVRQDDWEKPELTRLVERLASEVNTWPGAILVAHSLGCPFVAHLALQRPDLSIRGALLVASADVDSAGRAPGQTRGFTRIPLCPFRFRSIVVASTRPLHLHRTCARIGDRLGAPISSMPGRSVIATVDSGFGPWPDGQRMVNSLIVRVDARSAGWSRAG